jgi:hypothetical protein
LLSILNLEVPIGASARQGPSARDFDVLEQNNNVVSNLFKHHIRSYVYISA